MKEICEVIAGPVVSLVIIIFLVVFASFTVGTRNLEELKQNAPAFLEEQHGFKVVGYQGYEQSIIFGACAWYTMTKNDIVYECNVMKWRGEYHLYSLKAINAVTND